MGSVRGSWSGVERYASVCGYGMGRKWLYQIGRKRNILYDSREGLCEWTVSVPVPREKRKTAEKGIDCFCPKEVSYISFPQKWLIKTNPQ